MCLRIASSFPAMAQQHPPPKLHAQQLKREDEEEGSDAHSRAAAKEALEPPLGALATIRNHVQPTTSELVALMAQSYQQQTKLILSEYGCSDIRLEPVQTMLNVWFLHHLKVQLLSCPRSPLGPGRVSNASPTSSLGWNTHGKALAAAGGETSRIQREHTGSTTPTALDDGLTEHGKPVQQLPAACVCECMCHDLELRDLPAAVRIRLGLCETHRHIWERKQSFVDRATESTQAAMFAPETEGASGMDEQINATPCEKSTHVRPLSYELQRVRYQGYALLSAGWEAEKVRSWVLTVSGHRSVMHAAAHITSQRPQGDPASRGLDDVAATARDSRGRIKEGVAPAPAPAPAPAQAPAPAPAPRTQATAEPLSDDRLPATSTAIAAADSATTTTSSNTATVTVLQGGLSSGVAPAPTAMRVDAAVRESEHEVERENALQPTLHHEPLLLDQALPHGLATQLNLKILFRAGQHCQGVRHQFWGPMGRALHLFESPLDAATLAMNAHHPSCTSASVAGQGLDENATTHSRSVTLFVCLVAVGRARDAALEAGSSTLTRAPLGWDTVVGERPGKQGVSRVFAVYDTGRVMHCFKATFCLRENALCHSDTGIPCTASTSAASPPQTSTPAPSAAAVAVVPEAWAGDMRTVYRIPSSLRGFFVALVQRARTPEQATQVQLHISAVLRGTTTPRDFVAAVSRCLQAPPPSDLEANLTRQLARVLRP